MDRKSKRQRRQNTVRSSLNAAIEAVNLAKDASSMTPATAAFAAVSVLLTAVKDSMANKMDYVELGLTCANVCKALDRGMRGKKPDDLSHSVCGAIEDLTRTVAEIQRTIIERGGRNLVSRLVHAKDDKDAIAAWKSDLNVVLQIFNTELAINTYVMVADLHRNVSMGQEGADGQRHSTQTSIPPGEMPPPPLRAFFGRDELIERIISLAEDLASLALIGPGGIGKTTIALAVLHHDRIRKQFGDNRWFIRCDQFPSLIHFLSQLSKVIGAGVENPKDLTPLRPFLSSRKMILVLDNAESILDPQRTDAQEIYAMAKELSQFSNVCLCITSRISTIPPACETLDIPTLSIEAAHDIFYSIYKNDGQSGLVSNILEQLDFHPLSITLLATVAYHSKWDVDRLIGEWERQRTDVLHTQYNESLAATIELSLASPMFQQLGPDAQELLGVIAFFPQGIDEKNLDWLFSTLSNRRNIFDSFCILSLTYQSNGFITMLAPLRDYLCPKDPASSPFLCTARDNYFHKLSVHVKPGQPGFKEAEWIITEDINVEHLLNVFTSIDANSTSVWDACAHFIEHLCWHKRRLVMLGPKVEELPDNHPSKPQCLIQLSWLFASVGNNVEYKRLLVYTLRIQREHGDNLQVAHTLKFLSNANRQSGLYEEGIEQMKEALEIYEQANHVLGQAQSWQLLGQLLYADKQLDAAEEATSQAIKLLSEKDNLSTICRSHRLLGEIYHSKGETEISINHFKTALRIASSLNWHDGQFWNHYSLAELFSKQGNFSDAQIHIEHTKSHAVNGTYNLGHAMELQAEVWYKQHRLKEAKLEALGAIEVFEKLGAMKDLEGCRKILQNIEEVMNKPSASC